MKLGAILWWCLIGACLLPVVMSVGLAVGFALLQLIDPLFDHFPEAAGQSLMILTASAAVLLVFAAFRSTGRRT